ncbi:MAG: hypothetical protein L0312_15585, partial [Acidobacteria bacterium]|nr:hypothetical protein [Acidobacteriota bacterium]
CAGVTKNFVSGLLGPRRPVAERPKVTAEALRRWQNREKTRSVDPKHGKPILTQLRTVGSFH